MSRIEDFVSDKRIRSLLDFEADSLAEWSKAPALGAGPQGRGFESHSCHIIAPSRVLLTSLRFANFLVNYGRIRDSSYASSIVKCSTKTVWPSGLRR